MSNIVGTERNYLQYVVNVCNVLINSIVGHIGVNHAVYLVEDLNAHFHSQLLSLGITIETEGL